MPMTLHPAWIVPGSKPPFHRLITPREVKGGQVPVGITFTCPVCEGSDEHLIRVPLKGCPDPMNWDPAKREWTWNGEASWKKVSLREPLEDMSFGCALRGHLKQGKILTDREDFV